MVSNEKQSVVNPSLSIPLVEETFTWNEITDDLEPCLLEVKLF